MWRLIKERVYSSIEKVMSGQSHRLLLVRTRIQGIDVKRKKGIYYAVDD